VTAAEGPALAIIRNVAEERGAKLWRLGPGELAEISIRNVRPDPHGVTFDVLTPVTALSGVRINLAGEHQARNAALAAAAALWTRDSHPDLGEREVREGLERAQMPGRLQRVREEPLVLLDGAHSPDRAEALALALRTLYLAEKPDRRLILVLGCSAGHAPGEVVSRLAPLAAEVVATRSGHLTAVPTSEIAQAARASGVPTRQAEPVLAALSAALAAARPQDLVLVTGSLFVVGEALAHLTGERQPAAN
jgi:dihydrofolate synthase/folylpolyglutamate synthase